MFAQSISFDGLDQQSMYFIGTAIAGIVTIVVNFQVRDSLVTIVVNFQVRDSLVTIVVNFQGCQLIATIAINVQVYQLICVVNCSQYRGFSVNRMNFSEHF